MDTLLSNPKAYLIALLAIALTHLTKVIIRSRFKADIRGDVPAYIGLAFAYALFLIDAYAPQVFSEKTVGAFTAAVATVGLFGAAKDLLHFTPRFNTPEPPAKP